jgi:hypothetical protein
VDIDGETYRGETVVVCGERRGSELFL